MPQVDEALELLKEHHIPFYESNVEGNLMVLNKNEIDLDRMRKLGFRISRLIGDQLVVTYKGGRFGLVV